MPERTIKGHESLPLTRLQPYHQNARKGRMGVIQESLETLGQYRELVVNIGTMTGRPYEVLAGNHTAEGARQSGWDQIECTLVDVDEQTARKINLVDNRSADLAVWDDDLLTDQLSALDGDLIGSGWTQEEIESFLTPEVYEDERAISTTSGWRVTVECTSAEDQAKVLAMLRAEGREAWAEE